MLGDSHSVESSPLLVKNKRFYGFYITLAEFYCSMQTKGGVGVDLMGGGRSLVGHLGRHRQSQGWHPCCLELQVHPLRPAADSCRLQPPLHHNNNNNNNSINAFQLM